MTESEEDDEYWDDEGDATDDNSEWEVDDTRIPVPPLLPVLPLLPVIPSASCYDYGYGEQGDAMDEFDKDDEDEGE